MVKSKPRVALCLFALTLLTGFVCKGAAGESAGHAGARISGSPTMFSQQGSRASRIIDAIDESSLVTLYGNTHPLAQAKFDRGPAPLSMQANRLLMVLARSKQQEAELQTYLQSVQDANSPNYRKFLSSEEFGKSFGIGDADLQAVQTWLIGHGFTVSKVSKGRMAIEFSGSVGQVQDAFHTSIHSYVINGEQHWANAKDPKIPSALSPVVAGLASLNNFKPKALAILGPSGTYDAKKHTISPAYTTGDATNGYYIYVVPADAATIYNTPTALNPNHSGTAYDGTGVTIGIAGDSNIDLAQIANYRSTFGLPAKATSVVVDGNDPGENGDEIEAYLDTEVAGGLAPNASVILYTAANTDLNAGLFLAITRALDDNQADILNVSFLGCESAQGTAGNQYILDLWEQAAAQGVSVTVASGDSGSAGCDDENTETAATQGLAVNGLASTPYNIAVGGTDFDTLYSHFPTSFTSYVDLLNTLPDHRSALSYIPEEPWNDSTAYNSNVAGNEPISFLSGSSSSDNIVAGGGGTSSTYPVPTWQASVAAGNGRNLPDVSLLAGNGFYGALWGICTDLDKAGPDCAAGATGNNFSLTGVGGTSAAAPAFAGILALVEQKTGTRLGQADYVLYDLAKSKYSTVFHDVNTGDNSVDCTEGSSGCSENATGYYFMTGYNATTGYDQASGLGSVDASQLSNDWAGAGLAASTSSLQLNGSTSALSITHGQSVSVAASVSSAGGTPAGVLGLVDSLSPATNPNSESIADFTLAGGAVSGTTDSLPGGTYKVSAHYSGSSSIAASDSNSVPVTVAPESSTTSLKVVGYFDPVTGKAAGTPYYGFIDVIDAQPYGNSATLGNPNGAATGTITFKYGSSTLAAAAIASDGIAEFQTTTLPGGSDILTAVYSGDASFMASTSAPYSFAVVPALTTLTEPYYDTSFNNFINLGISLSTDSAGAAPTGSVTFQNGSTSLGSAPLYGTAATSAAPAAGTASFRSVSLAPGTYNITGVYSGDGNYGTSTSPAVVVVLPKASTTLSMTTTIGTILTNQPVQVTLTAAQLTGLPVPTGSATLTYSGVTTAASNLVNGTASFTIPANSLPGSLPDFYTIQGNYSGDADYASGISDINIVVTPSGTIAPTMTVTTPTATANYPVSITVAVDGPAGDPTPTGTVTLSGPVGLLSMPLINGSATFVITSNLGPGPNSIFIQYLGDSNYTGKNGNANVTLPGSVNIGLTPYQPTIAVNQSLTQTIAVTGVPNFATATGTVTLSSGSYNSGPVALIAGSASIIIPANSLAIGTDTLATTYSGDSDYLGGVLNETVTVNPAPNPVFSISGTAITLAPGAKTSNTSSITVTPSGGFTGSVTMTAAITSSPSGAQDSPALSFGATTPVSITGTSAGTATLTITTTAPSTSASVRPRLPGIPWYVEGGAALACMLLFGVPARRRRWQSMLGMLGLFVFFSAGVFACGVNGGGGSNPPPVTNPGTTPGAYTITVTATSGTLAQTATVTLTVQ
jgi:trimeric autotransporter adhesin